MKTAAIYCRVSTDNQEREGTSLQTQIEACMKYCQDKGYETVYRYSEAYSGLSLERLELDKLRELVRSERIDVIVCYSLDRLSRDPGHGVIITQEMEKHGVKLETVTEDVDNSELGRLINYIRGYASKVEAQKIKERTMRGKIACAKQGRMTAGFQGTYGYDYERVIKGERPARRIINQEEARWVVVIFEWYVYDRLTTGAIRDHLTKLGVPNKKGGKRWYRSTVLGILTNPAYCGRTIAFKETKSIEIPNVTPAIISEDLFDAAQEQLKKNKANAKRNKKRDYLLSGHVRCKHCNHAYVGGGDYKVPRFYRCVGRMHPKETYSNDCRNKNWNADQLEAIVWGKMAEYLSDPKLVAAEVERQRQDATQISKYETDIEQIESELRKLDRDQKDLLVNAMRGFPESLIISENQKINSRRELLKAQKAELEAKKKSSEAAVISIPCLQKVLEGISQQLKDPDYATKRDLLDCMNITVWLDGLNVEIAGAIPIDDVIVNKPS